MHREVGRPKITEAMIEQAVTEYLTIVEGWRVIKTDLKHLRGLGVQERGMPDRLFLRYSYLGSNADSRARVRGEVLWIEFKAPGKLPRPDQLTWHAVEQARGALVLVCDDYDDFVKAYRVMGLARGRLK